jgi:hypothetical protein
MLGLSQDHKERPAMNKDDRMICTLVRWLARKAVRAEWKAMGRRPEYAEPNEIAAATNVYFMEHRNELLKEAWEHPVAQEYRHQERMRLAKKAVIAEIRDRGGRVNSIAPEELKKLVEAYLKDHPWEGVIKEFGCY